MLLEGALYRPKYYLTISTILVFTPIVLGDCWTKNYESYRKVYSRCLKLNKKKNTKISQTVLELLRFTWINAGSRQAPDIRSARMMPLVFVNVGYSLVSSLKILCQSVKGQETSLSQPLLSDVCYK